MTVHSYSGSTLLATVLRDSTPAGTFTAQTWKEGFAAPVLFSSYVADIRAAGDYRLKINGTVVATVLGVAALSSAVAFTPAAPVELEAAEYTFSVECTTGAVLWYARGNIPTPGVGIGGTGWTVQGWGYWQEAATGTHPAGELRFQLADDALTSGILHDSTSSGSFTGMSWPVTFDEDVVLSGIVKRTFASDTWKLSVDGSDVATSIKAAAAINTVDLALVPPAPVPLTAGMRTLRVYAAGGSKRMVYRAGTAAAPSGSGSAHTTAWGVWTESVGNKVPAQLWFRLAVKAPTAFSATPTGTTTVDLDWDPPASGAAPAGYEYRVDGGGWVDVGAVTSFTVSGLTPDTSYLFEVRAYLSGLYGPDVDANATTDDDAVPLPEGVYRVVIDVGPEHETTLADVTLGDVSGLPLLLPLTLGWDIADSEKLLPAQASPTMLKFSVRYDDSTDVPALLDKGQPCSFRMYVNDSDDPWQEFDGTIVQLDGSFVRRKHSTGEWDWRVDVFASYVGRLDAPLQSTPVGLDEGDLNQRLDEIATEFPFDGGSGSIDYDPDYPLATTDDDYGLHLAMVAADVFGPTSVLNHLRQLLQWAVAVDEGPDPAIVGRWMFGYDPHANILRLRLAERRTTGADVIALDGSDVEVAGKWTKLLPDRLPGWGAVDGDVFGTPGTPPEPGVMVSTVYLAATSGRVRTNIADLILLAPEFIQLDGWRTRQIRHFSYRDPEPWRLIFRGDGEPVARLRPIQVSNLDTELRVDGSNYILGLLSGVSLTIPPRGKHYMTVKLRPELPPGYEPPGDLDPPLVEG